MSSQRVKLLLVIDDEENASRFSEALTSLLNFDIVETATRTIKHEDLCVQYPFGKELFDFVCIIITKGQPDLFLDCAARYVVKPDRLLLVSSQELDLTTARNRPLAFWRLSDLKWANAVVTRLYEEALRIEFTGPSNWDRIKSLYKNIVLRKGTAGILLMVISALITGVGYIKQVQDFAGRYIPHNFTEAGEKFLVGLTLSLTVVGSLLVVMGLVLEKLPRPKTRTGALLSWALAAGLIAGACFIQACLSPKGPRHIDVANETIKDCAERLWGSESTNLDGGMYVTAPEDDEEIPPLQPWITAQCIVGLVVSATNVDLDQKTRLLRDVGWLDKVALDAWKLDNNSAALSLLATNGLSEYVDPPLLFYDTNEMNAWLASNGASNLPSSITAKLGSVCKVSNLGGWGYFCDWQPSITEIEAWVIIAKIKCLSKDMFSGENQTISIQDNILSHLAALRQREVRDPSGLSLGLSPVRIPFNCIDNESLPRTYSTAMALWAHVEALDCPQLMIDDNERKKAQDFVNEQIEVLIHQVDNYTTLWVPNPTRPDQHEVFLGLSGQVLHIIHLATMLHDVKISDADKANLARLQVAFVQAASRAKVWTLAVDNNERIHDADRYLLPLRLTVEGSTYLWYPWTLLSLGDMQDDPYLKENHPDTIKSANDMFKKLSERLPEMREFALSDYNYVSAETLYCVSTARPKIENLDNESK